MTGPIHLTVFGEPQPQGNKTAFRTKSGRNVVVEGRRPESRAAFKSWRGAVESAARDWQDEHQAMPLDEPVEVTVTFWLTKPDSLPKWRWLPRSRPDVDKLARAVLDGITGTIVKDDGRVTDLIVRKRYALTHPPGCEIDVVVVEERVRQQQPEPSPALI